MQVVITAVGPDNRGLADPIVHSVTGMGANIAEIQMYDHDEESVFSMLTRIELDRARFDELRQAMSEVARRTKLSIRTWTPDIAGRRPRLAICVTYRPEPALAAAAGDSRRTREGRRPADDRQSRHVPRAGRAVRRAVVQHRREAPAEPAARPTMSG